MLGGDDGGGRGDGVFLLSMKPSSAKSGKDEWRNWSVSVFGGIPLTVLAAVLAYTVSYHRLAALLLVKEPEARANYASMETSSVEPFLKDSSTQTEILPPSPDHTNNGVEMGYEIKLTRIVTPAATTMIFGKEVSVPPVYSTVYLPLQDAQNLSHLLSASNDLTTRKQAHLLAGQ